ncbi:MAG: tripartite tricarboxylate transporter substrate binding protein [Usitatibacter sp.]
MYLTPLFFAVSANAQDWPQKTIRMIAPFAAASTPDTVARMIADRLEKRLGKPVVVENKPGAGGTIGTDAVAKALPDGYTIGVSIGGALVTGPLLYKKLPYDPDKEIAPVTLAVNQPSILVVTPAMKAANVAELTAELKRKPGAFNYASIGNGSISHLAMELIAARSGTELVHVAYPGSSQAVLSLLAGDTSLAVLPAASVMPQVKAGKLRALAVTTARRSSLFPEIPTLAEQGMPGVEANAWVAVIAPAATPKPILKRLEGEVGAILRQPEVVEALRAQMMEAAPGTSDELRAYMKEEHARWKPIIEKNRIALD